jgi:tetratricopeptide (TPR) repeat protein
MRILLAQFLFLTLISCQNKQEKLITSIENLQIDMEKEAFPSLNQMQQIISLFDEYIEAYPEDEKTYSYTELKAKYQAASQDYLSAVTTYEVLIQKYPDDSRTPEALFMQGFIYENNLKELEKAKKSYQIFLQKYPSHELVEDVKFSLENLSLSDEELLMKILNKENTENISE